jgi:hypothetical protein
MQSRYTHRLHRSPGRPLSDAERLRPDVPASVITSSLPCEATTLPEVV